MRAAVALMGRARSGAGLALACCLLLGLAVLWLLVRLVLVLWPSAPAPLAPPVVSGAVPVSSPPSIARWHLFGEVPAAAGPGGAGASSAPLDLILRGTVAAPDPAAGIAVLAGSAGEQAWRVGEEVAPGARLTGVWADHVKIERGGSEQRLDLPRERNLAPAEIVRPTPGRSRSGPAARSAAAVVSPEAPRTGIVPAAPVPADPGAAGAPAGLPAGAEGILERLQVVPVLQGTRLAGFRLGAGSDAALLASAGLEPGDTITAVNGQALDSVARSEQLLGALAGSRQAQLRVLREGRQLDVQVHVP